MARQRLTYKLYPVSTRVDPRGVYYGIIQGATTEPESSLREILAYKKITAFDPAQVVRLVEDVIQGGMELTALDGRPRAISSMLKTYLGFDKSFATEDARVTDQKLMSKVRLLKDLRVDVNMADFTLVNDAETSLPFTITSVIDYRLADVNYNAIAYPLANASGTPDYPVSYIRLTGRRLDEPYSYRLKVTRSSGTDYLYDVSETQGGGDASYSPSSAPFPLYRGFYSAALQVIWNPSGGEFPASYPDSSMPASLQALNQEGNILYETPIQFVYKAL